MKKLAVAIVLVVVFAAGAARAEEESSYTVSVSATWAGRYVWRGLPLNEDPTLQPGVEIGNGGPTVGAWASIDLTDIGKDYGYGDETGNATEVDFYASYAIPLSDKVELSGGFANYTFPHTSYYSTTEIFAGLAFDVPSSPSITTYIDEDLAEGANYTSLDLSHSFELWSQDDWGLNLDLAGHVGYANHKYFETYFGLDETPNWSDWSASVALPFSMPAGFTLTPSYVYSSMIHGEARDLLDDGDLDPEAGFLLVSLSWDGEF